VNEKKGDAQRQREESDAVTGRLTYL